MSEMNATSFKAHCLEVMDRVARTREEVIITKRGKPIARLVPVVPEKEALLFGALKGTFSVQESDLLAPASEPDEWNVLRDAGHP
jgi:prevent-host-death family protein